MLFPSPYDLELPTFKRMLNLILGIISILILIVPGTNIPDRSSIPWILLACLGSAFYGLENIVISAKIPDHFSPMSISCISNFFVMLILAPVVNSTGKFFPLNWSLNVPSMAIICISIISAVCYTTFIFIIKHSGPVFASQTAYIVALTGVFWGMKIFGESHSQWVWLCLLFMFLGLALVTPRRLKTLKGSEKIDTEHE